MDITDVINELLNQLGPIDRLTITTLGYNAKNLNMILEWLDAGQVKNLTLCTSVFHRAHKGRCTPKRSRNLANVVNAWPLAILIAKS